MSGRISSRSARKLTVDEVNNLVYKLQEVIPEMRRGANSASASLPKTLKEACNYIESLNKEAEDLSERLAELLSSLEASGSNGEA